MTSTMRVREEVDAIAREATLAALSNFELQPDRGRSLATLIESEIIPRLVAAHPHDRAAPPGRPRVGRPITADDVAALLPLALEADAGALIAHIETIQARGITADAILVDLLAPAARRLGEDWEADRCTFVDVTMALWRLQEAVHVLAARVPPAAGRAEGDPRRALFAAMPGDQHGFGTVVIDEVFRRAGWDSERACDADTHDLLHRVAADWYDLVGLTVSCDCHIGALGPLIAALRNVSRNPQLCVMVGGRVIVAQPQLALEVGADGTAADARSALRLAAGLVRTRAREGAACN